MLEGKGWGGVLESWFREGEMGGKRGGRGRGGGGSWITLGTDCCCCANPIHLVNIYFLNNIYGIFFFMILSQSFGQGNERQNVFCAEQKKKIAPCLGDD